MISAPLFAAFAFMTAFAALVVLWPLGRHRTLRSERSADLAVYRDQLDEISRDKESGRLPAAEAEAARAEVARRLIAADAQRETVDTAPEKTGVWRRRVAAVLALLLVPVLGVGIYGLLGSPGLPGAPLAARLAAPPSRSDVAILVRKVEEHLAQYPNDGQGYEIIAPIYLRLRRPQDAAQAYAEAIRILGSTAERQSARGEALVLAGNGIVKADALQAFKAAVAIEPDEPRANYFLGVAAEQDGRTADALKIWQAMVARAPEDAPYLPMVRMAIARAQQAPAGGPMAGAMGGGMPGPTAADVANAAEMSAGDRSAMIRGMVSRLEERLNAEPNDLDGWLRLARAFTVLQEKDKAKGALEKARKAFASDPQALQRIEAAEKTLGSGG